MVTRAEYFNLLKSVVESYPYSRGVMSVEDYADYVLAITMRLVHGADRQLRILAGGHDSK